MPSREIQDGLIIVFPALLLTPGLLTDFVGFMLLIPAGRELIRRTVLKRYIGRFKVQVATSGFGPQRQDANTINVDAVNRKPDV